MQVFGGAVRPQSPSLEVPAAYIQTSQQMRQIAQPTGDDVSQPLWNSSRPFSTFILGHLSCALAGRLPRLGSHLVAAPVVCHGIPGNYFGFLGVSVRSADFQQMPELIERKIG